MNLKKIGVLLLFSLIGWALCGGVIAVGRSLTTMEATLIIHAVAVPVIFTILSWIYFKKFNYTSSLTTALSFLGVALFMDFFLIAIFIEKSFDMFKSAIGTWIPFALIVLSTYITGLIVKLKKNVK
jgi:uncharacterized membrane protein YhdT